MIAELSQFHFIRPLLLGLLPVAVLIWIALRHTSKSGVWENYLPKEVIHALRVNPNSQSNWWHWALLFSWLGLVLALAGPTWSKQAVPTVTNQNAMVIVLDLSPSMLAKDVAPDRLTLAKYKLIDILREVEDGQAALVAYAGDAHTVSPLTDDPRTIEALLPALHPKVMPSAGSNTEAAIELAQTLLRDAGVARGRILLISDGVTQNAINKIGQTLNAKHILSILGVGGTDGAPIPVDRGGFLRGTNGEIVLARLNTSELQSFATQTGGQYASLSNDNSDIERLLNLDFVSQDSLGQQLTDTVYDAWTDMGHWLVLLVLPLFMLLFRKGLVYVLPLFFLVPFDSNAQNESASTESSYWQNLWKTPDQQASDLMKSKKYAGAANKFSNQDWSAIANYRAGDYATAAASLEDKVEVTSLYNRANAVAFSGDLQQAIELYDKVLAQNPDHEDAAHNKQVLEKLIQQDQQQQQNSESDQNQEPSQDQEPNQDQQSQQENQSGSPQEDQQQDPQNEQQQSSSDQANQDDSQGPEQDSQTNKNPEEQKSEQGSETAEEEGDEADKEQKQSEAHAAEESEAEDSEQSDPQNEQTATTPLKDSSEQWLRSIQDDPSGLLRRKFEYQAWLRAQQKRAGQAPETNADQDRY